MPKPNYWKCTHCYTFFKDKTQATQHERECTYNPSLKHCDSCRYRKLQESDEQVKEYICTKNSIVDKSKFDCELYNKAPAIELNRRAETKEFS